jgi:hypothetical protein
MLLDVWRLSYQSTYLAWCNLTWVVPVYPDFSSTPCNLTVTSESIVCACELRLPLSSAFTATHNRYLRTLLASCLVLPSPVRTGFRFLLYSERSSSLAIPHHTPRHRDPVSLSPNHLWPSGLDRKRVFQLSSAQQIVPNHASTVVRSISQSEDG